MTASELHGHIAQRRFAAWACLTFSILGGSIFVYCGVVGIVFVIVDSLG